jgi:hypothetical protein
MSLPAQSGPWLLIQFRNHFSQTVGLLGRVISPSQGLSLNTGQYKQRINGYTRQTAMLELGFEPTIPASKQENTVHALDRAATVTCLLLIRFIRINLKLNNERKHSQRFWHTNVRIRKLTVPYCGVLFPVFIFVRYQYRQSWERIYRHEDGSLLRMPSALVYRVQRFEGTYTFHLQIRSFGAGFSFLIRKMGGEVHIGSTRHVGHWMAYFTWPGWLWWWRNWWNENWQGKPKYSEKTCLSATWSTTNPTCQTRVGSQRITA